MYDRRFFASQLGQTALLSIAAMITFAVFAGTSAAPVSAQETTAHAPMVPLA